MNAKTYMKLLAASFVAGVGLSFIGCAQSNNGAPAPGVIPGAIYPGYGYVSPVCSPGQFNIDGTHCLPGMSFEDACFRSGYGQVVNLGGYSVCRTFGYKKLTFQFMGNGGIKTLSPALPSDPNAFLADPNVIGAAGFFVLPGDRITIRSVNGGWGYTQFDQNSYLGGTFNFTWARNNCNEFPANGPQGLFVSDGAIAYPATPGSSMPFTVTGPMRLGFNAPNQGAYGCSWGLMDFDIVRCMDGAGISHPCQ